ncbi:rhodanese-like domain-containing protein [Fundidesulfovibrio terrae]|uniref:rhodanese-like domain-containing protein n=1 Tax=Fundidesulfovibrio terrae TaxID=2922866 RepID=UPI001FAF2259|nr:rhodanese-like domain-containing protein [Fundidesulfovibrio terrae]
MPQNSIQPIDIDADTAKNMLDKAPFGGTTVLDVRQNWEYEELHLPGAKLVPLGELDSRLEEIPRDKPILVYCRSGKRSTAAASLLAGQGFKDIFNMLGGIMAWVGAGAVGAPESGMQYRRGDESPDEMLALAFAMERELGAFYLGLADASPDPELKATFARLAGFEDKHKVVVYHLYKSIHPQSASIEDLAARATATVPEGGREAQEILGDTQGFDSPRDALEMAMGIEAQALDLYTRYAAAATAQDTREALLTLAKEERGHLRALGTMLDRVGGAKE